MRWSLSFGSFAAKLYVMAAFLSVAYVLVDVSTDFMLGRLHQYRFALPPILWLPFVGLGAALDFISRFLATAAPAEKGARAFGLIAFVMVLALVCVSLWAGALASVSRGRDGPTLGVQAICGILLLSQQMAFGLFLRSAAAAFEDTALARSVVNWLLSIGTVIVGGLIGWGYLHTMTRLSMDWRGTSWATGYVFLIGFSSTGLLLLVWYARLVARVRDTVQQGLASAFV